MTNTDWVVFHSHLAFFGSICLSLQTGEQSGAAEHQAGDEQCAATGTPQQTCDRGGTGISCHIPWLREHTGCKMQLFIR